MWEIVSIVLAISTVVATTLAFVYRKGKIAGIDVSCAERIERDVCNLQDEMGNHETESGEDKKTLHKRIDGVEDTINNLNVKMAEMKGSQDTFQDFVRQKL